MFIIVNLFTYVIATSTMKWRLPCLFQHTKHYLTARGGESTTTLVMGRHQGRGIQEAQEEEEEDGVEEVVVVVVETTTSESTSILSTLMTSSKSSTTWINNTKTFTHSSTPTLTLNTKPIKRDTSTPSRPTRKPWTDTENSFSRDSGADCLMTCMTTWRRSSPFKRTTPGLNTDSRVQESSTAGQWLSGGATWWPPSLTALETSRRLRSAEGSHFGMVLPSFVLCGFGIDI